MKRGQRSRAQAVYRPFARNQSRVVRLPGLEVLDDFTDADLEVWDEKSKDLDELHNAVYIAPMAERRRRGDEIAKALRTAPPISVDLTDWVRMVKTRYANSPLESTGSLISGGRFNIGADSENRISDPFPALYLAENAEIAFREFYQVPASRYSSGGLTPEDLALRTSSASFYVNGLIHDFFDASDLSALEPVAAVLASVRMPDRAEELMRKLNVPGQLKMVANAKDLRDELHSPIWRQWPAQFGVPSGSQQFADLVHAAGFAGIFYGSTKTDGHCVAIFPNNIREDGSLVRLRDPHEESVRLTYLDSDNALDSYDWSLIPTCDRPKP